MIRFEDVAAFAALPWLKSVGIGMLVCIIYDTNKES